MKTILFAKVIIMAVVKLGKNCKLYYKTGVWGGEFGGTAWSEAENIQDVKLDIPNSEADVTTRGSNGWKLTAPILKEASVEFDLLVKPGDAFYTAVRSAWSSSDTTTLALAVLDGDGDTAGTEGLAADWCVLGFARNESQADPLKFSVSCKPGQSDDPPQWLIIEA